MVPDVRLGEIRLIGFQGPLRFSSKMVGHLQSAKSFKLNQSSYIASLFLIQFKNCLLVIPCTLMHT